VAAAATAAELWQQEGDDARLVRALVTLSRQQWLTERTAAARTSAERAFELARPLGDSYQNALATLNLGGLLVVIDREADGLPYLDEALGIAERCGAASVAALCRNYRGSARLQLSDPRGCEDLLASMAQASELDNHEYVMRAYYNLIEGLWRLGEYREALGYLEQAESFGRLRGLGVTRLPRRPQPGTLTNPAGLTDRQLEILRLVAAGLSNAEIAQRLVVSTRTVDHHVSAILAKLGVPTRREAAARAAELEA